MSNKVTLAFIEKPKNPDSLILGRFTVWVELIPYNRDWTRGIFL